MFQGSGTGSLVEPGGRRGPKRILCHPRLRGLALDREAEAGTVDGLPAPAGGPEAVSAHQRRRCAGSAAGEMMFSMDRVNRWTRVRASSQGTPSLTAP